MTPFRCLKRFHGIGTHDQRVIELAHILDGLDHATHLVVDIGCVGREHIDLANHDLLLHLGKRIPLRQIVRPRRELRICGNHAEPLLVCKDFFAQLLPALIEQVHLADLIDPFLGRLVRIVRRAWHILDQERLVGRGGIELFHVTDRIVRHVGDQVVVLLPDPRIYGGVVAEQMRRPLVCLAAHEAIEILEAHSSRLAIGRTAPLESVLSATLSPSKVAAR